MRRRIFATLLSLCLVLGLLPTAAFAQNAISYVALGDSITTGYGLGEGEQSFAEIIAAENGYELINLAEDGATSADLLDVIQNEANAATLENADLITITIGGNDLMGALYEYLAEETDNTPEAVKTALESADMATLSSFAGIIGGFAASEQCKAALEAFVKNFDESILALRTMNNDVSIIVINQYNPYSYLAAGMGSAAGMDSVVDAFDEVLSELNGKLDFYDGSFYDVADVYTAFQSAEENPCNASISISGVNLDFHPNAYGHTLIAETVSGMLKAITLPIDSLYVNGADLLAADNYTVECGAGRAVYNPDTNTLTLENAKITSGETQFEGETIGISVGGGLNIVLEGENSIIVDGENSLGIYTDGGLSISSVSNGSLKIISGSTGIWTNGELSISGTANSSLEITSGGIGIYHSGSSLSISDCTLTIDTGEEGLDFGGGSDNNVTSIAGSYVTVNSRNSIAICNAMISITDSTVVATGGGAAAILALGNMTITDSTVTAHCTATNSVSAYYAGLRGFGSVEISGDSTVTATTRGRDGKISCGVFGRSVTLERGGTLTAEGEQAAVRANVGITVPDGYLPEGYSIRQVFNTCDADDDIYTIAEDGAEVTYTYEYILGGSSTDILTGAATSVILKEPAPVPDPDPDRPSHDRDDDDDRDPAATTESERNPDGSITTTVTKPDGTTTATTRNPDGSKEVVETKKDGTVVTTATDKSGNETKTTENTDGTSVVGVTRTDGSTSATTVDKDGLSVTVAALSEDAVARGQTGAVSLPMPGAIAAGDLENAPAVTLDLPGDTSVRVEIPVENMTAGTVAVLVTADGGSEIVKTSVATESGVVLTLSGGETVKLVDNTKTFADVAGSFWGAEAVTFVTSRELFQGTGAATFDPNAPMDRAMIVTVLARLDGVDTTTGGTWYEAGAQWAMSNGISDGSSLDQNLTREQLAVMLYRYAQYKGYDVSAGEDANILSYADAFDVSEYAIPAMQWACGVGVISGKDGALDPAGSATRAEVAAMLMRFCQSVL